MSYNDNDTIAAISTGLTPSGIGIIRISGDQAVSIADRVFVTKSGKHILQEVPTHTIHYGFIRDGGEILDEVMVSVMRSPRSFTREDIVEINCHGGVYAMKRVLETVIRAGARPADPGEFTKRAFLNGRIDLTQAEAVMDLIESGNEYALENSIHHLKGSLRNVIGKLRSEILYETAAIESALDDPEHYSLDGYSEKLNIKNQEWMDQIQKLIDTFDNGRLMQEGIETAIVGKPNAGKSSLMNALLGQERAIVTDVAGTTRDVITEQLALNGITLIIRDTAGIRKTKDKIESIGIDRAKESIRQADLVICVIDSSEDLDDNDREILRMIRKIIHNKKAIIHKKAIIVLNKSDLPEVTDEQSVRKVLMSEDSDLSEGNAAGAASCDMEFVSREVPVLSISAKKQTGLSLLTDEITKIFGRGDISFNDQVVISNIRQKVKLQEALESLKAVEKSIRQGMPEDFFSIDLTGAYTALGEITGESAGEDLIDEIFSKFCMGK